MMTMMTVLVYIKNNKKTQAFRTFGWTSYLPSIKKEVMVKEIQADERSAIIDVFVHGSGFPFLLSRQFSKV